MIGLLVFEQIKESEKQGRRPKEDPKMYEFKPKRLRTTDRHNIAIYIQVFCYFDMNAKWSYGPFKLLTYNLFQVVANTL